MRRQKKAFNKKEMSFWNYFVHQFGYEKISSENLNGNVYLWGAGFPDAVYVSQRIRTVIFRATLSDSYYLVNFPGYS